MQVTGSACCGCLQGGAAAEEEEPLAVLSAALPVKTPVVVCCGATAFADTGDAKKTAATKASCLLGPRRLVGTALDGIVVRDIISGPVSARFVCRAQGSVFNVCLYLSLCIGSVCVFVAVGEPHRRPHRVGGLRVGQKPPGSARARRRRDAPRPRSHRGPQEGNHCTRGVRQGWCCEPNKMVVRAIV
jgi:hypothetical protein